MVTERLQIRQITLLAMLTAMCVVLRIFKIIPIPNVQPVTDILMIATLYLGIGSGITLAALTMLISNIYLGIRHLDYSPNFSLCWLCINCGLFKQSYATAKSLLVTGSFGHLFRLGIRLFSRPGDDYFRWFACFHRLPCF